MKTLPDSFYKNISTLPICEHLPEISEALKSSPSHFLILTAETAAGKSTAVAPYFLEQFDGKIFMLEPRRLAVLSIANRISELLEEECGLTCGYRIQLENKISKNTRLEIMTEGILTRRLQEDPLLESVNLVILDEFHERSIHSDLALAFLKEAVEIRDDLFVIIMSATMDTKALAQYLGDEKCPILNIKGRKFPVEIEYREENLCSAVIQETKKLENGKAILVFLPGISEINRTCQELQEFLDEEDIQILRLHSSLSLKEQKAVLSPLPPDKKRIVLSSSIAETSLTVPGIYTVIDSGLTRLNRMNVRLGMEELVTQAESIFSAEQRAGRAGRLGNGRCIRLWNKNEIRPLTSTPEILRTDLSSLVLECALRNIFSPNDIHWLTKPADSAWNGALLLLELLGCISENPDSPNQTTGNNASQNLQELQEYKPQCKNFSVTPKGKALAKLGLHPRLGSVAICGAFETVLKYSSYAKSSSDIQQKFLNNLKSRISQINPSLLSENRELSTNSALLEGFPDRIARLTSNEGVYQFPSGRAASFSKNLTQKINTYPEWIIAPEVDAGETKGIIYSWEKLESSQIQKWLESHSQTKIELSFEKGKIQKNRITSFGKIVLQKTKLPVSSEDYAPALCSEIQNKGFSFLPSSEKIQSLLERAAFYLQQSQNTKNHEYQNQKIFTYQENSGLYYDQILKDLLCKNPQEWLLPFLSGKTQIDAETLYQALYWKLDGSKIDSEVPFQITLPNGKKRRLSYEKQSVTRNTNDEKTTCPVIRPVLEIIIQQIFGCFETPKIMGMPVLLKLLSPARRPLQITDDLNGFWNGSWPEICKEMKGRYPKHNWDYRVVQADLSDMK